MAALWLPCGQPLDGYISRMKHVTCMETWLPASVLATCTIPCAMAAPSRSLVAHHLAVTRLDFGCEKRLCCATHLIEQDNAANYHDPAALDAATGKGMTVCGLLLDTPYNLKVVSTCIRQNRSSQNLGTMLCCAVGLGGSGIWIVSSGSQHGE